MLNGDSGIKYRLIIPRHTVYSIFPRGFPDYRRIMTKIETSSSSIDKPPIRQEDIIKVWYCLFINYSFKYIHTIKIYTITGSICLLSLVNKSTTMHYSITNVTLHNLVLLFSLISKKYSYLCIDNISIF